MNITRSQKEVICNSIRLSLTTEHSLSHQTGELLTCDKTTVAFPGLQIYNMYILLYH